MASAEQQDGKNGQSRLFPVFALGRTDRFTTRCGIHPSENAGGELILEAPLKDGVLVGPQPDFCCDRWTAGCRSLSAMR